MLYYSPLHLSTSLRFGSLYTEPETHVTVAVVEITLSKLGSHLNVTSSSIPNFGSPPFIVLLFSISIVFEGHATPERN